MTEITSRFSNALADRYKIERRLGEGGMATVYLAHDIKHDRKVAVKVLRPELAAVIGAERFLNEIKVTANLQHPHILPLFDSGEADGFLYYVMPYVEGGSLRERLQHERQLSVEEAFRIADAVAAALAHAHRRHVIHRDIKPENILLQDRVPLVADFGISLAVTAAGGERLTERGLSLGTPHYMSPEQAAGDRVIDARSDQYSLAAVTYEMLGGDPPFLGSTAQAVMARHVTDAAPPITTVRPGLPAVVPAALARALSKARADRFDTVTGFAAALTAPAETAVQEKSIAVLPFTNMSADPDNEYFSDGITEEIINALAQLSDLHVASRTSSFYFKGKSAALTEVGETLGVASVLEGSVRKAGNRVRITAQLIDVAKDEHLWSERYDREIDDIFAVQDEIATAIAKHLEATLAGGPPEALVTAATDNVEAYEHFLKGRHFLNQRGPAVLQAVEHFERAVALDPGFVPACAGLAESYCTLGVSCFISQREAYEKASNAVERALSLDPSHAEAHRAAAILEWYYGWDLEHAEKEFRTAIELSPRDALAHAWLAYLLGGLGRSDETITFGRRAHELDPLSPLINSFVGLAAYLVREYDIALEAARAVLEIDPDYAIAHMVTALCLEARDRKGEAVAAMERAAELNAGYLMWNFLAVVYATAGRHEAARATMARFEDVPRSHRSLIMEAYALLALGEDAGVEVACAAVRNRTALGWLCGSLPFTERLNRDPRWIRALEEVGLRWVAQGWLKRLGLDV